MKYVKIVEIENLSFFYGKHQVLFDVSVNFPKHAVSALTGPSGSGKSTLLITINRLCDEIAGTKIKGRVSVLLDNKMIDVFARGTSLIELRRKVGMVFQIPNPLPMSIYKNLTLPLKMAGIKDRKLQGEKVEQVLRGAFLWPEVKDRLHRDARSLSGGQQQRLCIARALMLEPEILLLDEPTSSLDEGAVAEIENLILNLKDHCSMIMVSHDLNQVKRVADNVVELSAGNLSQ